MSVRKVKILCLFLALPNITHAGWANYLEGCLGCLAHFASRLSAQSDGLRQGLIQNSTLTADYSMVEQAVSLSDDIRGAITSSLQFLSLSHVRNQNQTLQPCPWISSTSTSYIYSQTYTISQRVNIESRDLTFLIQNNEPDFIGRTVLELTPTESIAPTTITLINFHAQANGIALCLPHSALAITNLYGNTNNMMNNLLNSIAARIQRVLAQRDGFSAFTIKIFPQTKEQTEIESSI